MFASQISLVVVSLLTPKAHLSPFPPLRAPLPTSSLFPSIFRSLGSPQALLPSLYPALLGRGSCPKSKTQEALSRYTPRESYNGAIFGRGGLEVLLEPRQDLPLPLGCPHLSPKTQTSLISVFFFSFERKTLEKRLKPWSKTMVRNLVSKVWRYFLERARDNS